MTRSLSHHNHNHVPDVQGDTALQSQVGGNHYKDMKIQWVEFVHANQIPAIEGAIIKYICRWRKKNGVQDLLKAKHYIDMLIELENKVGFKGQHGGYRPGSGRPKGSKNKPKK